MSRSSLVVGAQVVVYVNGNMFGKVIDFEWVAETPRRFIQTVDSLLPIEAIPLATSVTGIMNIFKIHGDGGAEGAGMVAPMVMNDGSSGIPLEKYFTLMVLDRAKDTVLFQADTCTLMSQRWGIKRGHVTGSLSFRAFSWNNEIS